MSIDTVVHTFIAWVQCVTIISIGCGASVAAKVRFVALTVVALGMTLGIKTFVKEQFLNDFRAKFA